MFELGVFVLDAGVAFNFGLAGFAVPGRGGGVGVFEAEVSEEAGRAGGSQSSGVGDEVAVELVEGASSTAHMSLSTETITAGTARQNGRAARGAEDSLRSRQPAALGSVGADWRRTKRIYMWLYFVRC
jgi:hypothetical protein